MKKLKSEMTVIVPSIETVAEMGTLPCFSAADFSLSNVLRRDLDCLKKEIDSIRNLIQSLSQDTDFLKREFSAIQSSALDYTESTSDEFLQLEYDALRRDRRCIKYEL
jgi:hypothetical protein